MKTKLAYYGIALICALALSITIAQAQTQSATCNLSTGDTADITLESGTGSVMVLQDVATFSSTTTITVRCNGPSLVFSQSAVLTTLRVGSVQ